MTARLRRTAKTTPTLCYKQPLRVYPARAPTSNPHKTYRDFYSEMIQPAKLFRPSTAGSNSFD